MRTLTSTARPAVSKPRAVDARSILAEVHRREHASIIAPLVRLAGSLDAAEELVQDAYAAALAQWPTEGLPDVPAAWIARAARNKAIDRARRRQRSAARHVEIAYAIELARPVELDHGALRDDLLRLVFTCCHPFLPTESQVALTLRTVCGLRTEEIAHAFLVPPSTMAQRLVRAQSRIREAAIPYRVPSDDELAERVDAVLATAYLVFNEGYGASAGEALVRHELCREAIRIAELMVELLPERGESLGLLALMLLHDSRRDTRMDDAGELVVLEAQDRARWDHAQIARALPLVEAALRRAPRHPHAIQAAIAALHARAARAEDTDWPQIAALYAVLAALSPSPVVELNQAVAIAMAGDLDAGLARLDALHGDDALTGYHLLPAARADLLRRRGDRAAAADAYRDALALVTNDVERRYLTRRLAEVTAAAP